MPTVLRLGPYRFFFFAGDRGEPRHVHVERDEQVAKFWLDPVRPGRSGGFRPAEVRRLAKIVDAHAADLRRSWDDYFGQ